jgi:hypothetical protein
MWMLCITLKERNTKPIKDTSELENFVNMTYILQLFPLLKQFSGIKIQLSPGTSESYAYGKQRICFSKSGSAHFHVS